MRSYGTLPRRSHGTCSDSAQYWSKVIVLRSRVFYTWCSPIIREAPELKNYYVAAGLNSIGILTGGGVGKILANWIKEKTPPNDFDLTRINVDRFHSYQYNPMYREERVGETLGDTYKVHYPDHFPSTCRDVKRSPLHSQMAEQNAFFRDVSGWESPSWFAPKGEQH